MSSITKSAGLRILIAAWTLTKDINVICSRGFEFACDIEASDLKEAAGLFGFEFPQTTPTRRPLRQMPYTKAYDEGRFYHRRGNTCLHLPWFIAVDIQKKNCSIYRFAGNQRRLKNTCKSL